MSLLSRLLGKKPAPDQVAQMVERALAQNEAAAARLEETFKDFLNETQRLRVGSQNAPRH